jgi:hypothetical protein
MIGHSDKIQLSASAWGRGAAALSPENGFGRFWCRPVFDPRATFSYTLPPFITKTRAAGGGPRP